MFAVDRARLRDEASQFAERDWRDGTLPLVSAYGDPNNREAKGPMRATPHLARCPHASELLTSLGTPIGRTRFVRAADDDASYYGRTHITTRIDLDDVQLLIDTAAQPPHDGTALTFETVNLPVVMHPSEVEALAPQSQFARDWRALWSLHGDAPSGWRAFAALRDAASEFPYPEALLNPELAQRRMPRERGRIERPVFVVAPEGSGAESLLAMLAQAPNVFTAPRDVIDGERLTAAHATAAIGFEVEQRLYRLLRDRNGNAATGRVRVLDASPQHALRVPFLQAVFPDALFVYLYRDPKACGGEPETWARTTNVLLDDLESLPPERWMVVSYDRLADEVARICEFVGFPVVPAFTPATAGAAAFELDESTRATADRAKELFARPPAKRVRVDAAASFRSVHTSSFAEILHSLGVALIVTTYQSGRVILVRASDGKTLNTHLRHFDLPMGVAVGPHNIALGTRTQVLDFRNHPAAAAQMKPRPDACFVPRNAHVTGDIRIHEIGFAHGELWVVNTRFSALCTLDRDRSFIPRWKPPFITELAAEDRCHLNGMCIIDDAVRYVTALGETNTNHGWREHKARGGILMDVATGEILLRGLSMPHSPRFSSGQHWLLESGKGTLATHDLHTLTTVAELPGFTRGLAFAGPFAFVGLSQVRESNIFGGIPLVERVRERQCGIWIVDTRTGQTVALLRFDGIVQEIFDVQVLPARYPELLEVTDPLVSGVYDVQR